MKQPKNMTPAAAMAVLGQALMGTDALTRNMLEAVMRALLNDPARAEHFGHVLERTLRMDRELAEIKEQSAQVLSFVDHKKNGGQHG